MLCQTYGMAAIVREIGSSTNISETRLQHQCLLSLTEWYHHHLFPDKKDQLKHSGWWLDVGSGQLRLVDHPGWYYRLHYLHHHVSQSPTHGGVAHQLDYNRMCFLIIKPNKGWTTGVMRSNSTPYNGVKEGSITLSVKSRIQRQHQHPKPSLTWMLEIQRKERVFHTMTIVPALPYKIDIHLNMIHMDK